MFNIIQIKMNKIIIIGSPESQINFHNSSIVDIEDVSQVTADQSDTNLILCFDHHFNEEQIRSIGEMVERNKFRLIVVGDLSDDGLFKRYQHVSPVLLVEREGDWSVVETFIEFLESKHSKAAEQRSNYARMLTDYKERLKNLEKQISSMSEMLEELSRTNAVLMESEWEKEEELNQLRKQISVNN